MHDAVQLAQFLMNFHCHGVEIVVAGSQQVQRNGCWLGAARSDDFIVHRFQALDIARQQHHGGAVGRSGQRNHAANALRSASNQNGAPGQQVGRQRSVLCCVHQQFSTFSRICAACAPLRTAPSSVAGYGPAT